MTNKKPIVVIAGLDDEQRPHAARFAPSEGTLAVKAAALMGMKVGFARTAKAASVARTLPKGRVFATGRGLVPYVKQEVFDQLSNSISFETAVSADEPVVEPAERGTEPLCIGDTVLCLEGKGLGWWEAVVLSADIKKDRVSLRWRDFPDIKKFSRRVAEIAIIGAVPSATQSAS
jgi:hypothetical protein